MRAMKQLLAVTTVVIGSTALTGCSGSKSAATTQGRATVESSSSDCDFKQITTGARREGTCVARGVRVTVVDRAHWLHGKDYDGRIRGWTAARALGRARARGRFVAVRLGVRNTLAVPHEFDRRSDLAFLLVDGKYVGESATAEDAVADSFRRRTSDLQPGEVANGTVVFDVPVEHAKHITANGSNLILVSFADEAKHFPTGTEHLGTLGYIRLWK
jgi:hypothetical protein